MSRNDAKMLLRIGSIFFPLGLVILLLTRAAGIGMTGMGLIFLLVGAYYFFRGKR